MSDLEAAVARYAAAAAGFVDQVRAIPDDAWDGPGLGAWNLRSLVGHASRSLITVDSYLGLSPAREDVHSGTDYYARAAAVMIADEAAVLERGRQAGLALGDDPVATVEALVASVLAKLADCDDRLIAVIGGLGIRLSVYLSTRVFELVVHGCDIADATGIAFTPSEEVLEEATVLAAQIAVATGRGETALMALTGRRSLPPGFSVV